jgi:hypothetical protein
VFAVAEGSTLFQRGALAANFKLLGTDTISMDLDRSASAITFLDIDMEITRAPLKPLYDAVLAVFHGPIVAKITAEMNHALRYQVPREVNQLLAAVPSEVGVSKCSGSLRN